jgi:ubiquinone/menaquinone biosynthesis C-methylase UbiE
MPILGNERVREAYRRQAPRYDRVMRFTSRLFDMDSGREWACGMASGEVLELCIGTGLNLPFYPANARLTAVDLSPDMLARSRRRADQLGRAVHLYEGDVTRLPFEDGSFDTVVSTLALCTIPDPPAAVREAWRVCRPGGELRFFDHGIARARFAQWGERLIEPLTLRLEADRLTVDPGRVFDKAGVQPDEVIRTMLGIFWRVRAIRR